MKLRYIFLGLIALCTGCSIPSLTPNPTNPNAAASSDTSPLFKNVPNFNLSIPLFGHTQCYTDKGIQVCPSSPTLPSQPYTEPPSSSQFITGT